MTTTTTTSREKYKGYMICEGFPENKKFTVNCVSCGKVIKDSNNFYCDLNGDGAQIFCESHKHADGIDLAITESNAMKFAICNAEAFGLIERG